MKRIQIVGFASLLIATVAWAEGPFDGKWFGESAGAGVCGGARLAFEVKDGKIMGTSTNQRATSAISGHVNADGTAIMNVDGASGDYPLTFSGNSFEMQFRSGPCLRSYKGNRNP